MIGRTLAREVLLAPLLQHILPHLSTEQWANPSTVAARQAERAFQVVLDAYTNFRSYRHKLEARGITPAMMRGQSFQWQSIPTVSREDLGRWPEITAIRRMYAWRVTGGSGGPALRIPMDRQAYFWFSAGTWRGLQWWGVEIGDRGIVLLPSGGAGWIRSLAGSAKDWMLNWLRLPADDAFDLRVRSVVARIMRDRPAFIYGYPSALARLSAWIVQHNLALAHPRVIVASGEHLYAFQRRLIEVAFGCPVAEEYGCSELGCIAFQCPGGRLHVTAENVLLEVAEGHQVLSNPSGQVLVTGLRNRLMPLIRYELGDVGMVEPDQCSCGRGLPAVRILGRFDQLLPGNGRAIGAEEFLERSFANIREPTVSNAVLIERSRSELCLEIEDVDSRFVDTSPIVDTAAGLGYRLTVRRVTGIPRTRLGKIQALKREPQE